MANLEKEKTLSVQENFTNNYISRGVHYGHAASEWNPKMAPYILHENEGYHVFDLTKTARLLRLAGNIVEKKATKGKGILFVGTTKTSASIIEKEAKRAKSFYINSRWLGGLLTNWSTIQKRIKKFRELEQLKKKNDFQDLPKKERNILKKKLEKLKKIFEGVKHMKSLPSLVIFTNQLKSKLAIQECRKLGIPGICIVDTNCDPDLLPYSIPGNDDSMSSISFLLKYLANRAISGIKKRLKTTSPKKLSYLKS